ncbi:unnamed protein product [Arabidopsis lyrata]|uniref:Predicted protein n=1 Tax=Arabidopsis lyrata subsp. lyrata TaxID=81972 RepID=D7KKY2_ARALL|nr:predicted protein [Arabidopsis lyrata subsp. lyrata]CAH8253138.1 unnamed protein product [Arabidopsis lyrata]
MDAHHRQAAAHENRFRLMNPALFIVLLTVVPFLSSPVGLNPTNPPPGMTPATFQAIKITSQCFYPLSYLGLVSALAAIIVLAVDGPPVRAERVAVKLIKIALLFEMLSFGCLSFIRLSPNSLLSGLCLLQGFVMLVVLCFFIHFFNDHY